MAALAPDTILHIGSLPITNTLISTLLIDATILGGVYALTKNIKKIPGYFQNIVESIFSTFYELIESIAGKNVEKIFPYVMSFFLFILVANWSGLIPGVGTIGFHRLDSHGEESFVSLIRNATSDLNVTLGLALVSLVATHMLSLKAIGFREYISRYISLNPILLFVGVLEIVSEFTKVISLSFRLFGNIFAGEVVLHTISSLFAFIFPIPFMALELIVGLVQALVFAMLTMVFMSVLMTPHHMEEHAKEVNH